MIRFVHLERRFEKELEALWKRGEKGETTAQKAEELIAALTRNGPPDLKKVWKLTGWGEKRIEGCLKYDLGDGYRVICFRRRETLFISYIGDHDECHNWLDHYSGRHNWVAKENGTTLSVQGTGLSDWRERELVDVDLGDDFDNFLGNQLDDKTLRKIFSGLAKNAKQPDPFV
jgi:mRNA-degrading endonuclease YafQ of YafQ-DinJ toxin-antitoxin module